jgi:LPXTG-motif cell wall-anchored protein
VSMKRRIALVLSLTALISMSMNTIVFAETLSNSGKMKYIAKYSTGLTNEDGGVAEIVKYNKENQKMYLVNGAEQSVDIVSIASISSDDFSDLEMDARLDVRAMGEANGFSCGDITSVDVSADLDIVALAVRNEDYTQGGSIVILDYDGNYICHYEAGIQPDMITFSPDSKYVLTADEGEPQEGYSSETAVDPRGSVTVVDLSSGPEEGLSYILDFSEFDEQREQLVEDGVLLKPDTQPSTDLEPEFIAVSQDSKYAYITLQEANAIATLNLEELSYDSIKGLGFKDFSVEANKLDALKDGKAELSAQELLGVYMPDGIAAVQLDGKTYILTANEGDGREWGTEPDDYLDEAEYIIPGTEYEVAVINNSERDGLDADSQYLYGARSFSIWDAQDLSQVYDSGSDFERITAETYPEYFNSSNNGTGLDSRSAKKGPEPETVAAVTLGDKTYAFIGLERIGGVMMYDITNPVEAQYVDYINLRDFESEELSDSSLAPEGLCIIKAEDSPTGTPLLLAANEVSGNVDVIEILDKVQDNVQDDAESASESAQLPKTGEWNLSYLYLGIACILFLGAAGMKYRTKFNN